MFCPCVREVRTLADEKVRGSLEDHIAIAHHEESKIRNEALEEAAEICDECVYHQSYQCACDELAEQIRALRSGGKGEE